MSTSVTEILNYQKLTYRISIGKIMATFHQPFCLVIDIIQSNYLLRNKISPALVLAYHAQYNCLLSNQYFLRSEIYK